MKATTPEGLPPVARAVPAVCVAAGGPLRLGQPPGTPVLFLTLPPTPTESRLVESGGGRVWIQPTRALPGARRFREVDGTFGRPKTATKTPIQGGSGRLGRLPTLVGVRETSRERARERLPTPLTSTTSLLRRMYAGQPSGEPPSQPPATSRVDLAGHEPSPRARLDSADVEVPAPDRLAPT